jgi:hypothetical protein
VAAPGAKLRILVSNNLRYETAVRSCDDDVFVRWYSRHPIRTIAATTS